LTNNQALGTDLEFIRYLKKHGGETMKKCFQCSTCTVACELSPKENAFPRKEMIRAGWGLKDELISDPDIWLCHGCMDCSRQCPRGARPADLLGAIRSYIYRKYSNPSFMGKALSEPGYLPFLFLLPVILIFILMMVTQGGNLANIDWSVHQFKYMDFIAHGPIEMLFIAGNVLVFAMAYSGYKKYWNDISANFKETPKLKFIPALISTFRELMLHKKFNSCSENSNRYYGHIFIFYGFIGAMIATAIVVANIFGYKLGLMPEFLPEHMDMPLYLIGGVDFGNWEMTKEFFGLLTKSFGLLSGALLIIGGLLFILNRYQSPDRELKSTYNDMLFLWIIWGVATTGMLCVLLRLLHIPAIAFPTYFIHLVLVYFLLWYMPYSKFAHMIYRFLGLTFLKMQGRDAKPEIFINSNKLAAKITA